MAPAADLQPDPPSDTASPGAGATAGPARRPLLGDNPLQTVLAAALVGLLIFSLTSNRSRIARLEDTVNAGFAAQNAKIDALEDKFDTRMDLLDLKLTALIAALNKTEEVDAAIEGRLLEPDTTPP